KMSTIKFGTSLGASKTFAARSYTLAGKSDDPSDPNKLLQCPYDKNHQIRACRFPFHLLKCRKNHPKLASELKTCPFNAKHLMPRYELSHHIENCEDRQRCVGVEEGKMFVLLLFLRHVISTTNHFTPGLRAPQTLPWKQF
uniref:CHHC U11-48K-type domain-containing protein n=1 Tax=Electrophorus electricus TaxID=8005 RepID=A0AAY5EKX7_ELEEL